MASSVSLVSAMTSYLCYSVSLLGLRRCRSFFRSYTLDFVFHSTHAVQFFFLFQFENIHDQWLCGALQTIMVVVVRYISPNAEHIESLVHCGTGDDQQNVFQLEYLAEGNANTVYRLKPLDGHELPCELQGKLLRLRKDKPFIQSTKDQHAAFKCNFLHLFHKDNVVQHSLISINRDMLLALNTELDSLQASATRPKLRHSDKLAHDEEYGTLMTDMTARSTEILVELKPKWLLQSPDAPPGATRCRNCALRAQRMAHKANGGITPKLSVFCPLSLMDDDPRVRFRAAQAVVRSQLGEYTEHTSKA